MNRLIASLFALTFVLQTPCSAAPIKSLGDLNKVKMAMSPAFYVKSGDKFFLNRNTEEFGSELWVSDGTAAGTQLLKDIVPGIESSTPIGFVAATIGGVPGAYFLADTPGEGRELWVTDGTTAGTYLIKDINPGPGDGVEFDPFNGAAPVAIPDSDFVFFPADDGVNGRELWASNGDPGSAILLKDIEPGLGSSDPENIVYTGSAVFFTAYTSTHGREPWGTVIFITDEISDVNPGFLGSDPSGLTPLSDSLTLFAADDGVHGKELWKHESGVSSLVSDLTPGADDSVILSMFKFSATQAMFAKIDASMLPSVTTSFMITDGTAAGTSELGMLPCIPGGLFGGGLVVQGTKLINGKAVFSCLNYETFESEPWVTDGSAAGTQLLKDIFPGGGSSNSFSFSRGASNLIFTADDSVHGYEPWITDGTSGGTVMLSDFNPGEASSIDSDQAIFSLLLGDSPQPNASLLPMTVGTERGMYFTDGTLANTRQIFDDGGPGTAGSEPFDFIEAGESIIFSAQDTKQGYELFMTNGKKKGTKVLKNINKGGSSSPGTLVKFKKGKVLFEALDVKHGKELWRTDGTKKRTRLVKDIYPGSGGSSPTLLNVQLKGKQLLLANDGVSGPELWTTNGKGKGTKLLKDIVPGPSGPNIFDMAQNGDRAFFSADDGTNGSELWVTDGTESGTLFVADINPGADGSSPSYFTPLGDRMVFSAYEPVHSSELWITDGTGAGTSLIKDIDPAGGSSPYNLVATENFVFFVANDGVNGIELWRTDGSAAGTVMIQDIYPGATSSAPGDLTPISGDRVIFYATDPASGTEPWIAGANPGSAQMLKDIYPGLQTSSPAHFYRIPGKDKVVFAADDGVSGRELWRTDGTTDGTIFVGDIEPGADSSNPSEFFATKKKLYFAADTKAMGTEPYVTKIP